MERPDFRVFYGGRGPRLSLDLRSGYNRHRAVRSGAWKKCRSQPRCNSSQQSRLRRVAVEHLAVEAEPVPSILDSLAVAAEEAEEAVDTFTGTVEDSSAALGNWGLDISKIGTQVDLIEPPLHDLTGTIEGQSAAMGNWGLDITNIGIQFEGASKHIATAGGFIDQFKTSVGGLNAIFMSAFEGGGQLLGAVKSFSTQIIGSMMDAIVPGLGQFAGALVSIAGKLWSGIKNIFGASQAELAARDMFDGFHKGVVDTMGGTLRFADEVQRAIDDGWDRTLAETRAGFILMGTDMGKTYDEAFADYERYQNAVAAGNTELMAQIEAEYAEWRATSTETTDDIVANADLLADRFSHMSAEEIAELREALKSLKPVAVDAFRGIASSAHRAGTALNRFLVRILAVNRAIAAMPRDITIRTRTVPGRQHGGPVSAGSPYLVGEAGPEIFTPSSSGSVASNKSIPTADEIGTAVVAALHRVPLVVPQDAVTDSILRRSPNRQALRGWA